MWNAKTNKLWVPSDELGAHKFGAQILICEGGAHFQTLGASNQIQKQEGLSGRLELTLNIEIRLPHINFLTFDTI